MNLFEIDEQYQYILQLLEANEGEITPEIEEQLTINEEEFESKAASYRAMIMKWKADIAAAKEEEARIKAFKSSREKSIQRLADNLDYAMKHRNMDKLDMGVNGSIGYRKSTVVNIIDESLIPKKYINEKITYSPDKVSIKEVIKSGGEVKGCELVEKQNIQIK